LPFLEAVSTDLTLTRVGSNSIAPGQPKKVPQLAWGIFLAIGTGLLIARIYILLYYLLNMPALVIPTKREGVFLRSVTEVEDTAWFLTTRKFTHPLAPNKLGALDHGAFRQLQFERRRENRENPDTLNMGIWDRKTFNRLAFIGYAALYPDKTDEKVAEVGCRIAKQYRGREYATLATQTIIDYARAERGIESITARLKPGNWASLALVERLGFELIESHPDSMLFMLPNPSGQR
jgi:RimJ/RimL family protein N-acetyltransferase